MSLVALVLSSGLLFAQHPAKPKPVDECPSEPSVVNYSKSEAVQKLTTKPVKTSGVKPTAMNSVAMNLKANGLLIEGKPAPGALAPKDAGPWLAEHGFVNLSNCEKFATDIRDPKKVPLGAVVVYAGGHAGGIEIKTEKGWWSDKPRKDAGFHKDFVVTGVFVKPMN